MPWGAAPVIRYARVGGSVPQVPAARRRPCPSGSPRPQAPAWLVAGVQSGPDVWGNPAAVLEDDAAEDQERPGLEAIAGGDGGELEVLESVDVAGLRREPDAALVAELDAGADHARVVRLRAVAAGAARVVDLAGDLERHLRPEVRER